MSMYTRLSRRQHLVNSKVESTNTALLGRPSSLLDAFQIEAVFAVVEALLVPLPVDEAAVVLARVGGPHYGGVRRGGPIAGRKRVGLNVVGRRGGAAAAAGERLAALEEELLR